MTVPDECWLKPSAASGAAFALCWTLALSIRWWTGRQDWSRTVKDPDGAPNFSKLCALALAMSALYGFFFLLLVGALTIDLLFGLAVWGFSGQAARIASKWLSVRAGAGQPSQPAAAPSSPPPAATDPPAGDG